MYKYDTNKKKKPYFDIIVSRGIYRRRSYATMPIISSSLSPRRSCSC
jgi:hypothetical protein